MKTKSTTPYEKWDIILVSFPFTDSKSSKKRPAVIVSPKQYNGGDNVIILQISSQKGRHEEDYEIKNWESANLPLPSYIKMKFATIKKSIIQKKLGRLPEDDIRVFKNYL